MNVIYTPEVWYFLVMLITFVGLAVIKIPISVSLMFSALAGSIAFGEFFPLRHLVEGGFGYIDTILVIGSAMIFMESIKVSGLLNTIAGNMTIALHKKPTFLLVLLTFFIMIAGMITGSSTATVLTTGAIAFPVLKSLGLSKRRAGSIIAMSGIYGMIAPPINLPAMIIGQGVDMPYIGFTTPLLLMTFPLAIVTSLIIGAGQVKPVDLEEFRKTREREPIKGFAVYLPLILMVILMVLENVSWGFSLGLPLIFMLSAIVATITGAKGNLLKISISAIQNSLGILSILIGVGMFIQIMTLNGVRGLIVGFLNGLPQGALLAGIALGIPAFGAVSSYGSASVLGVPFLLAFLGNNDIVVCSALSLLAGLGDMVPPTALAGIFAAHVVGEKNYFKIWLSSMPAFFITMIFATITIIYSNAVGRFANSWYFYPVFIAGFVIVAIALLLVDKRKEMPVS
ncbi:MAG: TRAP transporter large permease subunit [Mesotoga sp.]|nr:TRAP transporter large permease subunit [Mesotoga sp.]